MSLTKTDHINSGVQNLRMNLQKVDFDASYPTGGEALTADDFGMQDIIAMIVLPKDGYVFEYDIANGKLKAFVPFDAGSSSAVAGANNTIVATGGAVEIAGTGNAFQQAGAEVNDTTDLSGITDVQCIAFGF
jgi:hypothetical protein